jgi:hypothetical protein
VDVCCWSGRAPTGHATAKAGGDYFEGSNANKTVTTL